MTEKLILKKIDNTAQITINNPSANTWDLESLSGLQEIIENLNKDNEIFALVITGQGDKFFSAGADLNVPWHVILESQKKKQYLHCLSPRLVYYPAVVELKFYLD